MDGFIQDFQRSARKIGLIVSTVLILAAFGIMIKYAMDMPMVHISQSTGECVAVYTPEGDGDCDYLPVKYETVIVE
jgi:hypothetical protein